MARVLVTGMSGAGKSTVLAAVAARGYLTVDSDYGGWVLPTGLWDEPRMAELLGREATVAVSGTVANQGRFYDRFEHVVHLHAPLEVLLARAAGRNFNPYGRTAADQQEIIANVADVEPLLRRSATCELDGRRPVQELADQVVALLNSA